MTSAVDPSRSVAGLRDHGEVLLEARGVEVEIGGTTILGGADLEIRAGELIAVVGPNGAGKSTLLRACAGLQRTRAGAIELGGEPISELRGRRLARLRAFVPQRGAVPEGVSVLEAVRIGRAPHLSPLRRIGAADHAAVAEAMARTGTTELSGRRLTTLSGGELQRVQIAIGLAQEAPLLMADEPTSHLDLGATTRLARLLRGLAGDGLAIVLVVHDLALAAAVADRVVVISRGRSVAVGSPQQVFTAERLADVWDVEARLEFEAGGRAGLRVSWLRELQPDPLRTNSKEQS